MNVGIKPLFGADPIFQTKRLTVYQAEGNDAEAAQVTWDQLAPIFSAVKDIFATSKETADEAAKPSQQATGLTIELGGKQGLTAQKVKEENLGMMRSAFLVVKETLFVFLKKAWWVITGSGFSLDKAREVANNLLPRSPAASQPRTE